MKCRRTYVVSKKGKSLDLTKINVKAVFVSDVHLGSLSEPRSILFLNFLKDLKKDSELTHLFLVGDIFDLWIGRHSYFRKKYRDVIDAIIALKNQGVEIHYFEGNHDLYLKDFWGADLDIFVYAEKHEFKLGETLVRVEHGDQMDPEDRGY